ncbi:hypothetical protein [Marinibactrum halimedae]|uniref:Uncharacterized protein n=1 Tax=Marinibactrum halimedae TaxID=1444977 RepID=A0AA37T479_9GAMM|nr:hypothetical protein [Marinibactrum halimedae]MCD9459146.1 hypothetical protein [Marinibactrum halimedae]GLS24748.1 hypothetical protein GCM10007877_04620 [Marinibactrum halimedae]
MTIKNTFLQFALTGIGLSLLTQTALAQINEADRQEKILSKAALSRLISAGLPETITENNTELAAVLLKPKLGDPLSKTLNIDHVIETVFENARDIKKSGNCSILPSKCEITAGDINGKEAFSILNYENNGTQTQLRFVKRGSADQLPETMKIDDREVFEQAMAFVDNVFKIAPENIPKPPSSAKNRLPVKTVNLSVSSEDKRGQRRTETTPVEKFVQFQRGFQVETLGWVPGPGELALQYDAKGLNVAVIQGWSSMEEYGRNLNPRNAKSRSTLIEEIASRFQREGIGHLSSARSHLAITQLPGDESPIPVLRIYAAAQPNDLTEEEQAKVVSSAGVVMDIALIREEERNFDFEESE